MTGGRDSMKKLRIMIYFLILVIGVECTLLYFTFQRLKPESEIHRAFSSNGIDDVKSSYLQEPEEIIVPEKKEVNVLQVLSKYRDSFETLETQATIELSKLVEEAYQEYEKLKHSEEKESTFDLYIKYYTAALSLEEKADKAFNDIYVALERDLNSNGMGLSHLQTIRADYEKVKEERRVELLKRAMRSMKD